MLGFLPEVYLKEQYGNPEYTYWRGFLVILEYSGTDSTKKPSTLLYINRSNELADTPWQRYFNQIADLTDTVGLSILISSVAFSRIQDNYLQFFF